MYEATSRCADTPGARFARTWRRGSRASQEFCARRNKPHHEPHDTSIVGFVDKTIDQVKDLLLSSPEFPEQTAYEVTAYLAQVAARPRHVETLAGPPRLVEIEAQRQAYAGSFHRRLFAELPMLSAPAADEILGPVGDVRGRLKRLRSSSQLVAVKRGNAFVYPEFQFDRSRHRIRPVVGRVNQALGAARDPWGALSWWTSPNPRWDRKRPIDHVDDAQLVELAEAEPGDEF